MSISFRQQGNCGTSSWVLLPVSSMVPSHACSDCISVPLVLDDDLCVVDVGDKFRLCSISSPGEER